MQNKLYIAVYIIVAILIIAAIAYNIHAGNTIHTTVHY